MNQKGPDSPYVTIASYRDLIDAEIARSRLAADGVDSLIENGNLVGVNFLWSNAVGGVKILVPRDKEKDAINILQERIICENEEKAFEGKGDCPNCGSFEVRKYSKLRLAGILSLLFFPIILIFGIPLLMEPTHWYCLKCGHKWREGK